MNRFGLMDFGVFPGRVFRIADLSDPVLSITIMGKVAGAKPKRDP